MHLVGNTVDGWSGVIADLASKRQSAREHAAELRRRKEELSLEAALGSDPARKELAAINRELARMALEGDDFDAAISQAESQKQKAERTEAEAAERARREQIGVALQQYFDEVRGIDDTMRLLAARFATARQILDRAEALMNSQERVPFTQLRSLGGPTLSAAHFGLSDQCRAGLQGDALRSPPIRLANRLSKITSETRKLGPRLKVGRDWPVYSP